MSLMHSADLPAATGYEFGRQIVFADQRARVRMSCAGTTNSA
jgi:hypothetical protein